MNANFSWNKLNLLYSRLSSLLSLKNRDHISQLQWDIYSGGDSYKDIWQPNQVLSHSDYVF